MRNGDYEMTICGLTNLIDEFTKLGLPTTNLELAKKDVDYRHMVLTALEQDFLTQLDTRWRELTGRSVPHDARATLVREIRQ